MSRTLQSGTKCCRRCHREHRLHKVTIPARFGLVPQPWLLHFLRLSPALRRSFGNWKLDPMNGTPHLLIVDDDKELCALLSTFLARHGYRVSTAHDGKAMMQILEAARVNLVILDLMLPGDD